MTAAVFDVKRVLVVDDDLGLTRLIARALEDEGGSLTIACAGSLADARAAVQQHGRPDVVVADVHLPNGDGRHLREELLGVPFVIVSGYPDEVPDLEKPFSMATLRAAVARALGR